jgi:hypothetical protein
VRRFQLLNVAPVSYSLVRHEMLDAIIVLEAQGQIAGVIRAALRLMERLDIDRALARALRCAERREGPQRRDPQRAIVTADDQHILIRSWRVARGLPRYGRLTNRRVGNAQAQQGPA